MKCVRAVEKIRIHSRIYKDARHFYDEHTHGNLKLGGYVFIDGLEKDLFEVHFQQVVH